MAKATKIMKNVREIRKVPRIQLELTEGEADFLLSLAGFIGGDPEDSPRKYMGRIENALRGAVGHDYRRTDAYQLIDKGRARGIFFEDYPADFKPGDGLYPESRGYNRLDVATRRYPA